MHLSSSSNQNLIFRRVGCIRLLLKKGTKSTREPTDRVGLRKNSFFCSKNLREKGGQLLTLVKRHLFETGADCDFCHFGGGGDLSVDEGLFIFWEVISEREVSRDTARVHGKTWFPCRFHSVYDDEKYGMRLLGVVHEIPFLY